MNVKKYIPKIIKRQLIATKGRVQAIGKQKIFCIGMNKTGTT